MTRRVSQPLHHRDVNIQLSTTPKTKRQCKAALLSGREGWRVGVVLACRTNDCFTWCATGGEDLIVDGNMTARVFGVVGCEDLVPYDRVFVKMAVAPV